MSASLMLIILAVSAVLTSIISAVIGMAGGVTLLSIMTFFLPWAVIVPVHGVVQLASNSTRVWVLRKNVNMRIFWPFLIGTPVGVVVAVTLIKELSNKDIPLLMIAGVIIYTLFKPKKLPPIVIPIWAFSILGMVAGFLGMLIGATGPLLAPFFLRKDLSKQEIVATKAATQTLGHVFKIPSFLYLGFNYLEHSVLMITMIIGVIVGTNIGVRVLRKTSDDVFLWLYKGALFFAAIRILQKVIGPHLGL